MLTAGRGRICSFSAMRSTLTSHCVLLGVGGGGMMGALDVAAGSGTGVDRIAIRNFELLRKSQLADLTLGLAVGAEHGSAKPPTARPQRAACCRRRRSIAALRRGRGAGRASCRGSRRRNLGNIGRIYRRERSRTDFERTSNVARLGCSAMDPEAIPRPPVPGGHAQMRVRVYRGAR